MIKKEGLLNEIKIITALLAVIIPTLSAFIFLDNRYASNNDIVRVENVIFHERLIMEQSLTLFRIDLLEDRINRERETEIPNNVRIADWRKTIHRLERRYQQIENQLLKMPVPLEKHMETIR